MMKLACPPAASSTRVCDGHFQTPIASLITNYIIHRFRLGSLTFLRWQAVPSNATSGGVPRLVDTVRIPTSTSLCYRHRQSPVGEIAFY